MENNCPSITVTNIPNLNTVVIKKRGGNFFISTRDSIVIDLAGLYMIIRFLVLQGIVSISALERIIDEFEGSKTKA